MPVFRGFRKDAGCEDVDPTVRGLGFRDYGDYIGLYWENGKSYGNHDQGLTKMNLSEFRSPTPAASDGVGWVNV